jgi:gliding motility-associated-like protein
MDYNPFYYRFNCYQSGTLGFLVTPDNLDDDYDWILYDITNRNPQQIYDSTSWIVTYNFSGNTALEADRGYTGLTGAQPNYTTVYVCATNPIELGSPPPYSDSPTINRMPEIYIGHTYLLMVSHYTQSQSGYDLSFLGGSAVITDTTTPAMKSVTIDCDYQTILVNFNKNLRCSSLAADGSDFMLFTNLATIVSATGTNCSSSFDMTQAVLKLSNPLPDGNYTLYVKTGTDSNTVLDDCGNGIVVGDSIGFSVTTLSPTPLDSLTPPICEPNALVLVFDKSIQCSSIAPDGSDFQISGPSSVLVQSATGTCDSNGLSSSIQINFNAPILTGGSYQLKLVTGTDGNTVIDKCGLQTPAGSVLNFTVADTVKALISYQAFYGCQKDSIQYFGPVNDGINQWSWTFDSAFKSSVQNPWENYNLFGTKTIYLTVSNGTCAASADSSLILNNAFQAAFNADSLICPNNAALFTNQSTGNIVSWYWNFGDGSNSLDSTPAPHAYPDASTNETYLAQLIIKTNYGCSDTAAAYITKLKSCYIEVPSGFTPNGDGINDYLYPLNAFKALNLEFRVYNRYGQLVFETRDWTRKWDGTIDGRPQPPGTFVWTLRYTDGDTGKDYFLKGTTVLIR